MCAPQELELVENAILQGVLDKAGVRRDLVKPTNGIGKCHMIRLKNGRFLALMVTKIKAHDKSS